MTLEEKIRADLTGVLKKKDEIAVSTLRFLLAELHNRQIQKQANLTDKEVVTAIRQQIKLRHEAIEAYRRGGRSDLVEKDQKELQILSKYLPQPLSPEELEKIVKETIAEAGAAGPKDFGKVMGAVMGKIKGRVEGNQVSQIVKKQLEISN